MKWFHGLSPKEHQEMKFAYDMREWKAEQREKDLIRQEKQRRSDRLWNIVMLFFAALVGVLFSYIQTLIAIATKS